MHLTKTIPALVLAAAVGCSGARAQTPAPLPEPPGAFDYPTVDAASKALKSRADVAISEQNNWTIIEDSAARTLWSFAPTTDPAYPAVVKRRVVQEGGYVKIRTSVLCEASKTACDNLVRQFDDLNAKAAASTKNTTSP